MRHSAPEVWILSTVFVIAGLVLSFGHIAEEVLEGDSEKFDQTIFHFFRQANDISQPIGAPWVQEMARDVTALGSYAVLIIVISIVVIYLFMAHQRTAALWVLAAVGGGVVLSNILKLIFERPRPDVDLHATRVFTTSFPSGHATLSAIAYLTLGALLAGLHASIRFKVFFLTLALLLTIAIGISRVYLGVHYPTDVIAGWCIGAAWATFCWTVFTRLQGEGHIDPARD